MRKRREKKEESQSNKSDDIRQKRLEIKITKLVDLLFTRTVLFVFSRFFLFFSFLFYFFFFGFFRSLGSKTEPDCFNKVMNKRADFEQKSCRAAAFLRTSQAWASAYHNPPFHIAKSPRRERESERARKRESDGKERTEDENR